MLRSLYSGVSGLRNHQQAMDVLGNNIANVNTPGFKSSRVTFMDTLSQTLQGVQQARATMGGRNPVQVGSGMTVAAIDKDMGQGSIQATGRNMDLAIEGRGFFIVGSGENYLYSRVGALSVDDAGNVVTNTGERIYGWVDTNQDGVIDSTQDELSWLNLDRRGDGAITNAVAFASPVITGANQGDASLGPITTVATTVSDRWTVEAVANPDFVDEATTPDVPPVVFRVVGERSGELVDPTGNNLFPVGSLVSSDTLGSFVINGGSPAKATLAYDVTTTGGARGNLSLTATEYGAGGNGVSLEFVNKGVNQTLSISVIGKEIVVSLGTDAVGQVTSTLDDVVDAINGSAAASALVTAEASGWNTGTIADTADPPAWEIAVSPDQLNENNTSISVEFTQDAAATDTTVTVADADLASPTVTVTYPPTATIADIVSALDGTSLLRAVAVRGSTETAPSGSTTYSDLLQADGDGSGVEMSTATTQYLQNGAGPNVGDTFTFTTTAPGGAAVENLTVTRDGTIVGTFENGTTEEIARVALANVPNPEGLFSLGGGKFAETPTSGSGFPPTVAGDNGTGTIASGYLEMSNVDLTREFTDMIVTQRGFQANSRVITTSDEMLQDLLALKR